MDLEPEDGSCRFSGWCRGPDSEEPIGSGGGGVSGGGGQAGTEEIHR